jgi:CheY-like chemotaxis protein/HPt (histidine-containing phosphotransfer) domain-containing protein
LAEMDGLALAGQIRQHRGSRDLPLVLLTALGQRPAHADLERLGISAVLSKPVKTSHLFDALVQILGHDRLVPPAPSPAGGADGPPLGERVPLRILLVEDNATNQRVTLGQLARLGYRADVAANGLEALDALERRSYDVALMDVQMPELDGLEATRRILARWPAGERPRIVAMTAHALQGDREECLRAGMDDYLAKPIRMAELADALTRAGSSHPAAAPAGAAASAESPLDAELLGKLRDEVGEEELPAILETFVAEVSAQLDALGNAIEAGDAVRARRLAHAVKGSGSYLGATELVARCAEIENLARADTLAPATELLAAARAAYRRVAAALADVQGLSR